MAYPSAISTLATPQPTDRLNSPSHSTLHQNENSGITEIQTFVGTLPASAVGTLIYDIRSPDSNGGGHIQTAAKGGTGQTSYTKGDLLVASGASVLTKLAVGVDGQIPQANSSVATGISWVPNSSPKIATSASVITSINDAAETSILSVTIPASTLGTSNALRTRLFFNYLGTNQVADSLTFSAIYGGSVLGSITVASINANLNQSVMGTLQMDIIANASATAQRAFFQTDLFTTTVPYRNTSSFVGQRAMTTGTLAVDSARSRTLGITAKWNQAGGSNRYDTGGYTVEKIA